MSKGRPARLVIGLVLTTTTLWIALPALGRDRPPPPPVGLSVRTDANDFYLRHGERTFASVLYLYVVANECRNPVVVNGTLVRSQATQDTELTSPGSSPPEQALVTMSGVPVRQLTMGLSSPPLYPLFVTGTGRLTSFDSDGLISAHNRMLPLIREGGSTTAVLNAPQWPITNAALHFVAEADLVRPAGFHSCYLSLPQLLSVEDGEGHAAYDRATAVGLRVAQRVPHLTTKEFPDFTENIGAYEVRANVTGRVVVQSSIGRGGENTGSGVRYLCHDEVRRALPANLDPEIARPFIEPEKPDCSGAPLFQAADVVSDTTRRLFIGAILGAIAATLLIEALLSFGTATARSIAGREK